MLLGSALLLSVGSLPVSAALKGEYFSGRNFETPVLQRTDSNIAFSWGEGSPAPEVPVNEFSVRWTGYLTAPYSETYSLFVVSDNGSRLKLNGQVISDHFNPAEGTEAGWFMHEVPFTAGQPVPLELEYYESTGGAEISLYWVSASQTFERISGTAFTLPDGLLFPPYPTRTGRAGNSDFLQLECNATPDNNITRYYTITGLPPGLTVAPGPDGGASVTGLISGTPTTPGTWQVNVHASTVPPGGDQSTALTGSTSFSWTILPPVPADNITAEISVDGFELSELRAIQSYDPNPATYTLRIHFSTPVTGLSLEDLTPPGSISNLQGSGADYSFTLKRLLPDRTGVSLKPLSVTGSGGATNHLQTSIRWIGIYGVRPIQFPSTLTYTEGDPVNLTAQFGGDTSWTVTGLPSGIRTLPNYTQGALAFSGTLPLGTTGTFKTILNATDSVRRSPFQTEPATPLTVTWTILPRSPKGWTARLFDGRQFEKPVLVRTDDAIEFEWAGAPATGLFPDNFSVKWSGLLTPTFSETYTFTIAADNGVRLWVDGKLVSSAWNVVEGQDGGWRSVEIPLTAGQAVPVLLDYYQTYGGANAALYWSSASQPWEAIPGSAVTPLPSNAPPWMASIPATSTASGTAVTMPLNATDASGAALTFSAVGLPPGVTLRSTTWQGLNPRNLPDVVTHSLAGTPFLPGTYQVTLNAATASGNTSTRFTWTVTGQATNPGLEASLALITSGLHLAVQSDTASNVLSLSCPAPEYILAFYKIILERSVDLENWEDRTAQASFNALPVPPDSNRSEQILQYVESPIPAAPNRAFYRIKLQPRP
ncbi:MAG: hypothetical protein JWL81_462 [Verrucomicrobiales bacterium]|nr:hypothetical protein [Verrucomicrobiales bacterium]